MSAGSLKNRLKVNRNECHRKQTSSERENENYLQFCLLLNSAYNMLIIVYNSMEFQQMLKVHNKKNNSAAARLDLTNSENISIINFRSREWQNCSFHKSSFTFFIWFRGGGGKLISAKILLTIHIKSLVITVNHQATTIMIDSINYLRK